jgi:endoglucanase
MFGLVNEPNTMPTEQWVSAANAAIAGIRQTGSTNVVLAPGNAWTGAHSWYDNWYGTPNATAMRSIVDPANKVLFEVHQYLDSDSSGSVGTCVSTTVGSKRLASFVGWLRQYGKKGILAELAGGRNTTCYAAIQDMLTYIAANADVLVGWLWWGGGPWWPTDYAFNLEPTASGDRPQMKVLLPFLK